MDYKYTTIDEIRQLPKYQDAVHAMHQTAKDPSFKNKCEVYNLISWYFDELQKCQEYHKLLEKEYACYLDNLVDVKDIALGDENIYYFKNGNTIQNY